MSAEEAEGLMGLLGHHRYQSGLCEEDALEAALVQSESLYRVARLLAYGNNLAGFCDIEKFARVIEEPVSVDDSAISYEEEDTDVMLRVEVVLPCSAWFDSARIPDVLSTPRKYHGVLNPNAPTFLFVDYSSYAGSHCQMYSMLCYPDVSTSKQDDISQWREAYKVIGQVIANSHAFGSYLGVYDGKPLFEPSCGFDSLWQAMVELADKQAPGICPVCGRVIDRRRDKKGGHPKKTCTSHSDKYHNMKKALRKSGGSEMQFVDNCEKAVRQQRWHDSTINERPLTFPGMAMVMEN